jgi:hypothetical protein
MVTKRNSIMSHCRIILLLCLSSFTCLGQFSTNLFTWPVGVSNAGPYPLLSVISNYVVMTPNSNSPAENEPLSHRYKHHIRVAYQSGITWIAAASAGANEAQSGQQCHLFWSTNVGATWSAPIVAVSSQTAWKTNIEENGARWTYPRNMTTYNGTNYATFAVDTVFNGGDLQAAALLSCAINSDGTTGSLFRISTEDYYSQMACLTLLTIPHLDLRF